MDVAHAFRVVAGGLAESAKGSTLGLHAFDPDDSRIDGKQNAFADAERTRPGNAGFKSLGLPPKHGNKKPAEPCAERV